MDESIYARIHALEDAHWWFRGRRAVIRGLLEHTRPPRPARILDAGCATGRNMAEFADLGSVTGIDPAPVAVDYCRRRGLADVVQGRLEAIPFGAAAFDLVFAFDVLEHLDDHLVGMRELRRVTADGGFFVATVPAYQSLWSSHDVSHHHRRRFRRRHLLAAAEASGWRPVFSTYFNSVLLPPIAAVRALRRASRVPDTSDYDLSPIGLDRVLGAPMQAEARVIARGVRLPAGVSIGMVCTTE